MTEVKKGGLIALVQETIKVVLVIAGLIACLSLCHREERLAPSCGLLDSRWTSTAASDNPPP